MFDAASENKLIGVHPDLVLVLRAAVKTSPVPFKITEGVRALARQKQLKKAGASMTLDSRHLTGHAADIVCLVAGVIRWDWPLYHIAAAHIKEVAAKLDIPIEWGGDWKKFPDGPHFQLPKKQYPAV